MVYQHVNKEAANRLTACTEAELPEKCRPPPAQTRVRRKALALKPARVSELIRGSRSRGDARKSLLAKGGKVRKTLQPRSACRLREKDAKKAAAQLVNFPSGAREGQKRGKGTKRSAASAPISKEGKGRGRSAHARMHYELRQELSRRGRDPSRDQSAEVTVAS